MTPWNLRYDQWSKILTVDGIHSEPADVLSGVPQGTVLGPLLFLLYINDLEKAVSTSAVASFADDTRLSAPIREEGDTVRLQEDMNRVVTWSVDKNMVLHEGKFEFLCYRTGSSKWLEEMPFTNLHLQYTTPAGFTLSPQSSVRDLGVTLTSDYHWRIHINQMAAGARQLASRALGVFRDRSATVMLTIWKSLIRCKLEYCCPLWHPHRLEDVKTLENVQRQSSKTIFDASFPVNGPKLWNTLPKNANSAVTFDSFKIHLGRGAIADYLSLVIGGDQQAKKVTIPGIPHPSVRRSVNTISRYFEELMIDSQDFLGTPEKCQKVLSMFPAKSIQDDLQNWATSHHDSKTKWNKLKDAWSTYAKKRKIKQENNAIYEVVLQLCYPRLDVNVTKGLNHLLKSPFSVHPKTGRVCVPFLAQHVDSFDPFTVPTLKEIIAEVDNWSGDSTVLDYAKTSLKPSIDLFKKFVRSCQRESTEDNKENNVSW
ncbi:hypothetical protein ACHWQZ_G004643 [Mnemiopsis leidyi]